MRNTLLVLASFAAALVLAPSLAAQTDTTPAPPRPAAATAGAGQPNAPRPRPNRNLITAEEIAEHPSRDLLELVRSLRPAWLRGNAASPTNIRGNEAFPDIRARLVVMHDGLRIGELEELRRIPIETVGEIRYLDGRDAVARYGGGFGRGAIEVTSRRDVGNRD
jgi:outer membrane receptor for ferrienterochelin and colicin